MCIRDRYQAYPLYTTASTPYGSNSLTSPYASSFTSSPYGYGDFQQPPPQSSADYRHCGAEITFDGCSSRRDELSRPYQALRLPPLREILPKSQFYTTPLPHSIPAPVEPRMCYRSQSYSAQYAMNISCQHCGGSSNCHGGCQNHVMTYDQRN